MSPSTINWLTVPLSPDAIMVILILDFVCMLAYMFITQDEDSFREMYGYYFFISVFIAVSMTEHQVFVNGDFKVEHTSILTWLMSGAFCYVLFLLFTWTVKSIIRIYFIELEREKK